VGHNGEEADVSRESCPPLLSHHRGYRDDRTDEALICNIGRIHSMAIGHHRKYLYGRDTYDKEPFLQNFLR